MGDTIYLPAAWDKIKRRSEKLLNRLRNKLNERFNRISYELLWSLYGHPQSWRFRRLLPVAHQVQLIGKLFLKPPTVHKKLVEGLAAENGTRLRMAYLGPETSYEWLIYRFFGENEVSRKDLGTCGLTALKRETARLADQADIIVVERNSILHWRPRSGTWVIMPEEVHMVMDFTPGQTWEQIEKQFKRTMEYNLRKVRKAGFQLEFAQLPQELEPFYENMYYPYTLQRHKDHAQLASFEYIQGFLDHAELKMVRLPEGQVVGGYLCQHRGKVMHWLYNGVLDGDQKWMEQGAFSALYYLGVRKDFERGIDRVDIGGVVPFEDDSLYQHKKRWGFRPEPNPWSYTDWLLWAPDETSSAAEWIKNHPPLTGMSRHSKNI